VTETLKFGWEFLKSLIWYTPPESRVTFHGWARFFWVARKDKIESIELPNKTKERERHPKAHRFDTQQTPKNSTHPTLIKNSRSQNKNFKFHSHLTKKTNSFKSSTHSINIRPLKSLNRMPESNYTLWKFNIWLSGFHKIYVGFFESDFFFHFQEGKEFFMQWIFSDKKYHFHHLNVCFDSLKWLLSKNLLYIILIIFFFLVQCFFI
jgi:hypothetical protein